MNRWFVTRWVVYRYNYRANSGMSGWYCARLIYYGNPESVAMETGGDLMPGEFTDEVSATEYADSLTAIEQVMGS